MYISEVIRVKKCVHGAGSLFYPFRCQPEFGGGDSIIIAERLAEIVLVLIAQHLGDVLNFQGWIFSSALALSILTFCTYS